MAIAKMQKLGIVGHKKDEERIVELLHDSGVVEILVPERKEDQAEVPDGALASKLSEMKFAIELLEGHRTKECGEFLQKILNPKIEIAKKDAQETKDAPEILEAVREVARLDQEQKRIATERAQYAERHLMLEPWQALPVVLEEDLGTRTSGAFFGTISSEGYDEFARAAQATKVAEQDGTSYVMAVFLKEREKETESAFLEAGGKMVDLPRVGMRPAEYLREADREIRKCDKANAALVKNLQKYAKKYLRKLKISYDVASWEEERAAARTRFQNSKSAFYLVGWAKAKEFEKLQESLAKLTREAEVMKLEPEEGEDMPIAIENSSLMRPFESITTLYGLPRATEVDPTPYLAIFFIVFFALCLTDAGYGLLLISLSYLALKFMKPADGVKKVIRLLMFGGFITVAIGALTGGWFGIVLADMPESMSFIVAPLLWIQQVDPIKDPMKILILSLVLGYLHLWFGLGIDMWWKYRNDQKRDALLGTMPWFIFFTAVAFWALAITGVTSASLATPGKYLVWGSLVLMVVTQGYSQKGILKKSFFGIGSLYSIIGYVSDLLSYSRLLALGLTTAVIAMVINIIALLFRDMIPYVGWIFMILVLVGGHIFNLVINVLGAFIHSSRLQFVEFFPKFFEGGGKRFDPLERESKYISVK